MLITELLVLGAKGIHCPDFLNPPRNKAAVTIIESCGVWGCSNQGWPARGVSCVTRVVGVLAGAAGLLASISFSRRAPSLPARWVMGECVSAALPRGLGSCRWIISPWALVQVSKTGSAVGHILISWLSRLLFSFGLSAVPVTSEVSAGLAELVLMVLCSKIVQPAWNQRFS